VKVQIFENDGKKNQNCIYEQINGILNSGSVSYYPVQNLSSRLLCVYKNLKLKIRKTIILPFAQKSVKLRLPS